MRRLAPTDRTSPSPFRARTIAALSCAQALSRRERVMFLVQNARDALDRSQLEQADQTRPRLAVGHAVDPIRSPVALEGLDRQAGLLVIGAARLQPIAQTMQTRAQDDDAQSLVARR